MPTAARAGSTGRWKGNTEMGFYTVRIRIETKDEDEALFEVTQAICRAVAGLSVDPADLGGILIDTIAYETAQGGDD